MLTLSRSTESTRYGAWPPLDACLAHKPNSPGGARRKGMSCIYTA